MEAHTHTHTLAHTHIDKHTHTVLPARYDDDDDIYTETKIMRKNCYQYILNHSTIYAHTQNLLDTHSHKHRGKITVSEIQNHSNTQTHKHNHKNKSNINEG